MDIFLIILFLALLILVHELGHFFAAKIFNIRVEEFGLGFPPRLFGKKFGETTYTFNALPLGGFVKIFGEDAEEVLEESDKKRSFAYAAPWKKGIILLMGIVMNLIFAWLALSFVFMAGAPNHLAITEVAPDSPAAAAGLKSGDVILKVSVAGKTLTDPIATEDFISLVDQYPAEQFSLAVERSGQTLNFQVESRANPPAGQGRIGIALVSTGIPKSSFFGSFIQAGRYVANMTALIVGSFYQLLSRIFTEPGVLSSFVGPVGIFVLAKNTGALGVVYLVQLMAVISINLAILNLIPFPALDGGRLLVVLVEAIKKSPVSKKIQLTFNAIGFAVLIILMIVITFKDVGRFILN